MRRTAVAELWLLLGAGVVLLGLGLGLRDPWPADEPRFALIARDMVRSGEWLFPRVAGEWYSDKPPLFMWLAAIFYALTGELRVAFLLPSLLAGLGMVALVHDLARRLWDRRVALAAGLLLLLSVQFTLQARSAQLDALVALWTTLGLYGLLRHLLLGPDWRWYTAGGFAMGLGVVTKGVGFLPLFVLLPWLWLRWWRPGALPPVDGSWRMWLLAPAALLVPVACWLLPMAATVWASGDPALEAYRDDLLFRQTVTRYADTWTHLRPAWYYLVHVIPWAWLPTTLALPWLLTAWRRRLVRGDARYWLLLGWVVCVLLFFSLSPGKRGVYLLPALPAFVLAAAPLLSGGLLRRRGLRVAAAVVGGVLAAIACGIGVALSLAALSALDWDPLGIGARLARQGFVLPGVAALAGVSGLTGMLLTAWGVARRREPVALGLWLAVSWLALGALGYPAINDARSARDLMAAVAVRVPAGHPLAMIGWKEQLVLQLPRPAVHFGFRRAAETELRDAAAWLRGTPGGWVLAPASQLAPCFEPVQAQPVMRRHRKDWVLVDARALTGRCAGEGDSRAARRYVPALGRNAMAGDSLK